MNGDVTLRVEGLMLERLLERAVSEGAQLSSIRRDGNHALIVDAEAQLVKSGLPVFHHIRRSDKVDTMTFEQDPLPICSPNSAAGVDYRRFVKEYLGGN